jgi:hypothetical protein
MNTSPQALPCPAREPQRRTRTSAVEIVDSSRVEAEENICCALWQNWSDCIEFREISGCIMLSHHVFTGLERQAFVMALTLSDGDHAGALAYLTAKGYLQPCLTQMHRLLCIVKNFPMSARGVLHHASELLPGKGGAS